MICLDPKYYNFTLAKIESEIKGLIGQAGGLVLKKNQGYHYATEVAIYGLMRNYTGCTTEACLQQGLMIAEVNDEGRHINTQSSD